MKKISLLILVLTIILSCSTSPEKEVEYNAETEKEKICNVIDLWHLDAAKGNFESYFNAMTPNSVFIGTDAAENWPVVEFKEFSEPHFSDGVAWNFTSIERNVYIGDTKNIAWFDELLDTWMGVCRGSGVMVKENSQWKIQHYVLSLTIPNDNIQDVIKVNKEKDSLFLKKFLIN